MAEHGEKVAADRRVSPWWLGLLGVLALGLVAFFVFDLHHFVTFETLQEHHRALTDFVADHLLTAIALYVIIYVAAIAFSVPGAIVLTVTGGFLFGQFLAMTLVVFAATAGATLIFLIAKTALGDPLRARAGPWLRRMEEGFAENAFNYLLVLRLVPLFPFFVVNLVPAFLGVPVRTYIAATFFGIMPGTFVFSSVGAGLPRIIEAGGDFGIDTVMTPEILAAMIGLAVLALIPVGYRHYVRRRQRS